MSEIKNIYQSIYEEKNLSNTKKYIKDTMI